MKNYLNKTNLLFFGSIIIIVFIIFTQFLIPRKTTTSIPIIPTPTPSILNIRENVNPNETTEEWNKIFNAELEAYEKSLNKTVEETLSYIRLNSPIDISGNTIDYSYNNATYTITLINPYVENQNLVLLWLKKKGIDQNTLKTLRVNWVQK